MIIYNRLRGLEWASGLYVIMYQFSYQRTNFVPIVLVLSALVLSLARGVLLANFVQLTLIMPLHKIHPALKVLFLLIYLNLNTQYVVE